MQFQYSRTTENKINEFTPISELQKLADTGDPAACYELGRHYRKGTGGCEKNEDRGNKYYIKGGESDTPMGWYCKAVCYELGIGTDKDARKAFELYHKAAEREEVRSQRQLGFCYQDEIGTGKDHEKAFEWFQKAAEQGDADAQTNLGWYYQEGIGTLKNERKAFYWHQKAADQGQMVAQCNLANCYWKEIGTPQDLKKAYYWYLKSAEQGFSNAQYWLGMRHFFGEDGVPKNEDTAVQWFTKAADQGHTKAQSTLGVIYFKRFEFEEAKKYLEPAAEKKDAQAQYFLAAGYLSEKYYRRANEGPMSNDESEEYAFILLVASMKQGHEDARKMLELHKDNGNLSRPLRGDMPIFSDNRELLDLLNR